MDSDQIKELKDEESDEDSMTSDLGEIPDIIFEEQTNPTVSDRNTEAQASSRESTRNNSSSSELSEVLSSDSNLLSPGKYTALLQRHRQTKPREDNTNVKTSQRASPKRKSLDSYFSEASTSRRAENTLRTLGTEPTLIQQLRDSSPRTNQVADRSTPVPSASSMQSSSATSGMLEASPRISDSVFRTSDPLLFSMERDSLIHRYREFNLSDNTERISERPNRASLPSNLAPSFRLETSLRASEGAAGLPGPFASFIQRHRDLEDDSDEEPTDSSPFWPYQKRPKETPELSRDSRSGSLSAYSDESTRSASETSHSSGHQETKESSASDPLLQQQQPNRELNPPNDEATDEDEGELESEEQSQDSDSERKGYSL